MTTALEDLMRRCREDQHQVCYADLVELAESGQVSAPQLVAHVQAGEIEIPKEQS